MAEESSKKVQQAVCDSTLLERIIKYYVFDRLSTEEEFRKTFRPYKKFLTSAIERGSPSYPEEREKCLRVMQSIRERLPSTFIARKQPLKAPQSKELADLLAHSFRRGTMLWQIIVVLSELIIQTIAIDFTQVTLVDQICHYFKTIHVSRDGLTVEEWIMRVGSESTDVEQAHDQQENSSEVNVSHAEQFEYQQEPAQLPTNIVLRYETLQMPRPPMAPGERCQVINFENLSQIVSENRPPAIRENRCPCGVLKPLQWNIMPTCNACKRLICMVPHCSYKSSSDISLRTHYASYHYEDKFLALFALHQILYCECGERRVRPSSEKSVRCERCSLWLCCAGSCTTSVKTVSGIQRHLLRGCNYGKTGNRDQCSQCRYQKTRGSQAYSSCPRCSTPRRFWCLLGNCEYEVGTAESVKFHQIMCHPEFLWT